MTTKKKVIIAVCAVVVVLIVVFVVLLNLFLDGFGNVIPKYEKRESGDFVVLFYEDHCEISGTTEQGNKKKYLVIPKQIEGCEVTAFGVTLLLGMDDPEIHSATRSMDTSRQPYAANCNGSMVRLVCIMPPTSKTPAATEALPYSAG